MVDEAGTYGSIDDDIFPAEEESSLSGIQSIRYFLEE